MDSMPGRAAALPVTLVSTEGQAGRWGEYTSELQFTNAALIEAGVAFVGNHSLEAFDGQEARIACIFTGRAQSLPASAIVPVTQRDPDDALFQALAAKPGKLEQAGIKSLQRIGDCAAPGTIAAAVYAGHKAACELGADEDSIAPLREISALA